MNSGNGVVEYAKDSMFPTMGVFGGYMFHNYTEYFGNPILTILVVYITVFVTWTIIRCISSLTSKMLKKKLLSILKRAER